MSTLIEFGIKLVIDYSATFTSIYVLEMTELVKLETGRIDTL